MTRWKPQAIGRLPGPLESKFGSSYDFTEESRGIEVCLTGNRCSVTIDVLHDDDGARIGRVEIGGRDLSARDIQRLPLASALKAAIAAARVFSEQNDSGVVLPLYDTEKIESGWAGAANKVLLPRGGPPTRRPAKFYKQIAEAYNALALKGVVSPVKEIARRKRVSENTVHQWVYKARELKFLDRSPRSRKR